MSFKELFDYGSLSLIALLTLVEITPIKLDPWTKILGWLGSKMQAKTLEKIETLTNDFNSFRDDTVEQRAKDNRTKILRFADELYRGENHSKEHYEEILSAIDSYDQYCEAHPDFPNSRTVSAAKRIKEDYEKKLLNRKFLE